MRTLEELETALAQDIYTGAAPECKVPRPLHMDAGRDPSC